jgi:hypothetical protein
MNDLAALIDWGISESSKEGVERPEPDLESDPLGGLKNPNSMMSACSKAKLAALLSRGLDKKLKARNQSHHIRQALIPRTAAGEQDVPIDVTHGLLVYIRCQFRSCIPQD